MNPRIKEFHHIIRASDPYASFQEQLVEVLDKLILLSEDRKLFFVRFFISDAANQVRLSDIEDILKQAIAIDQLNKQLTKL